ncbi:MAG: biopolymer transport protein ExbD [Thalassomonas sp.]|jgi:biopolymer transport protein ExbD
MASSRRGLPEINAGSMADIAFLLLIFFLVTTTMDVDTGIARKLPPMPEEELQEDDSQIHAKNIYVVLINANNQLLVEGELMDISQLRDGAKDFIDNNGTNPNSSENPEKAIISLQNDRGTEYMTYIRVQNELAAAYNELRNKAALNKFGERYADLNKTQKKEIRKMYPQKISEAEPKNIGGDS